MDGNTDTLALTFHKSFQQRTTKDWIEAFDDTSIPCGPINNIKQVFEDPQVNSKLRCILFLRSSWYLFLRRLFICR